MVYDLGCGDGIIVATAAQKFGATAVGIDIDPQRVKEATDRIQKANVTDKVKILNQDLFTTDISKATVVTLYLLPSLNQKLIPKLNKELKPGTRIVSQSFNMGDQNPPLKTVDVNGRSVYLWKTPLKEDSVAFSIRDRSAASAAVASPQLALSSPAACRLRRGRTGCRARCSRGSDRRSSRSPARTAPAATPTACHAGPPILQPHLFFRPAGASPG